MHLFMEKEMSGGISYIAKRYSTANNKYVQSYDHKKQVNIFHIWMQTIYMAGQ